MQIYFKIIIYTKFSGHVCDIHLTIEEICKNILFFTRRMIIIGEKSETHE